MYPLKKLSELLKIQNGYAFDSKKFTIESGTPLIRIRDLRKGLVTETNFDGVYPKEYLVYSGDFLIGMDGEFRCYEWKGAPALLNQRVCRLKYFSENLNSRYLFYLINKHLKDIEDVTGFTTVKHISSKQIGEIQIPLPPLSTQLDIVARLDSAMAEIDALRAETESALASTRELWESYLDNLEGEKISLGSLVDIRTGKLNANAMKENGIYPFFTCAKEIYKIDNFAFDCEAILLAGNNAVGDFNVKHYKGKFNAYQRTYVITVNEQNKVLYRYLYFQLVKSLDEFKKKSVGAGTKFLKLGMIQDIGIICPSIPEQSRIVTHLDAVRAETEKLEKIYTEKLASLDELRKSVLRESFL